MTSTGTLKRNAMADTNESPSSKKARTGMTASKDEAMLLVYLSGHSDTEQDEERAAAVSPSSNNDSSDEDKREEAPNSATPAAAAAAVKAATSTSTAASTGNGRVRLPDKLMGFLNASTPVVSNGVLWWQPDGDGFAFDHDRVQNEFLDVHFRGTKLASFIRSLNRWGFRRIFYHSLPKNALSFHHPLFQRKKPELVDQMKMAGGTHATMMDRMATAPASPATTTKTTPLVAERNPVVGHPVMLSQLVQVRPLVAASAPPMAAASADLPEPLWKKLLPSQTTMPARSDTTAPDQAKTQLQHLVATALQHQDQQPHHVQRLLELARAGSTNTNSNLVQFLTQAQQQQQQQQQAKSTSSGSTSNSNPNPLLASQLVQAQLAQQQALRQLVESQRRMQAIQQQLQQHPSHHNTTN